MLTSIKSPMWIKIKFLKNSLLIRCSSFKKMLVVKMVKPSTIDKSSAGNAFEIPGLRIFSKKI